MTDSLRMVAVIGASSASPEEELLAEEVGRLLASQNVALICGGGPGVMAAACRGARDAGGVTIGLLPGTDPSEANPYVSLPISTGLGEMRNALIVRSAEAVIAIGGGAGTLSEIGFAAKIKRRIIGLNTFSITLNDQPVPLLTEAKTPAEAVKLALQ